MINLNPLKTIKLLPILMLIFFASTALIAQEEERYELVSVQFHGNFTLPTSDLSRVVASKESPGWFSQFLNSFTSFGESAVYFDSLLIPGDMEALKNYYFDNGFFEARFFSNYYLDDEERTATIVYHIEEKDPSLIKSFKLSGIEWVAPEYQTRIRNEFIDLDTTERYSRQIVEEKIFDVISFLRDHGYMLVNNNVPVVKIDTMKNEVFVSTNIITGTRYKISELRVEKTGPGKELVEEQLLKDIVSIKPDQWYSFYENQRAQVRLYRTNLFSSVLVTGVVADTAKDRVPINISADVGLLNEISPEIILNNEDNALNFGFGIGYTRKNFFGGARKLSLNTSAAAQNITDFISNFSLQDTSIFGYSDARITIEQPYLFGRPINTIWENYITLQKRRNEYNATLYGSKLSFDFELPQYTYLTSLLTYLNFENSTYRFSDGYISRAVGDSLLNTIKQLDPDNYNRSEVTSSYLGVEVGANRTNNLLFPTRGYSLNVLLQEGNSLSYLVNQISGNELTVPMHYKIVFTSSAFLPLYNSETDALGVKLKVGFMNAYSGSKFNIPLNQRFYAGGSNSVRGWQSRELVPPLQTNEIIPSGITSEEFEALFFRGILPGGFVLFEGTVESRNRLIGKLGSAVFIDFGNTWNEFSEIRTDQIAVAAGFGIRYYSAFAPIRIDFGLKAYDPFDTQSFFKKKFFSETFEFHIGIGEAF
jgi:outer membrane protein insertion porin family